MNYARWMTKTLYDLKIYLFKNQFDLSKDEEKGLADVSIFILKFYLKAWFSAPNAISTPNND